MYACALPILLNCSPVIFPALLQKDFIILKRSLKRLSRTGRLCMTVLLIHWYLNILKRVVGLLRLFFLIYPTSYKLLLIPVNLIILLDESPN